jgi:hypothetical protein
VRRAASVAVLGLALSALVASPALSHFPTAGKKCGSLSFTAGSTFSSSHYGVDAYYAKGVSCSVAKKVAKASKNRGGSAFRSNGFACRGKKHTSSQGRHADYRCRKGTAVVTFATY